MSKPQDPDKEEDSKNTNTVRTIRIRTDVYEAVMERAEKENRNFNNMVETILMESVIKPK